MDWLPLTRYFKLAWLGLLLGGLPFSLQGQSAFGKWLETRDEALIEPYLMLQLWSAYSMGQEVYDKEGGAYGPVADRLNILLRRGRFGFRVRPYEDLKFNIALAYDLLGHDINSSLLGGNNNGSRPIVSVWDAFVQWRIKSGSERFNLVAGYFRPQLSRESITSAWQVSSFEKAMSQTYIRIHLTGIGPGRAPGLNLGGLLPGSDGEPVLNYNLGVFTPVNQVPLINSAGQAAVSPLLVGRLVYYLGDPEMERYGISYTINGFNEKHGLALGAGGSWQGRNDLFDQSTAASFDLLFNSGPLHIDGEVNFMWRRPLHSLSGGSEELENYAAQTGHLRAGYNLRVGAKGFLEPAFLVYGFLGPTDQEAQDIARQMLAFGGRHFAYDLGLNWYFNRNRFRLMLHYTLSEGDAGDAEPGYAGNLHFTQNGLGAIRRGNWLGLGLNALF